MQFDSLLFRGDQTKHLDFGGSFFVDSPRRRLF